MRLPDEVKGWRKVPAPAVADPVEPDCLLALLGGFNEKGYRLGDGGYYDPPLAAMPRRPLALAVGYAFQRLPTIRPQPFDRPMDARTESVGTAGTCPAPTARPSLRPKRTRTSSRSRAARHLVSCTSSERPPPAPRPREPFRRLLILRA